MSSNQATMGLTTPGPTSKRPMDGLIDDYNDPVRLNRLNLNRLWDKFTFNADLRWYDDITIHNSGDENDTLQQLPAIALDGVKQVLGSSSLYYDISTRYDHFYRIDGTRGQRLDLYPRVYYPLNLFDAVSVESSVGLRQTAWHINHYDSEPEHGRDNLYRAIYDVSLDVSSEFYRIFDIGIAGNHRLKHAVVPEIVYEFTPDQDQSDYPAFDDIDAIDRKKPDHIRYNQHVDCPGAEPFNPGRYPLHVPHPCTI